MSARIQTIGTFALLSCVLMLAWSPSKAHAGMTDMTRYNNEFISNGSFLKTPFEFTPFDVVEIRTQFDEHNRPWLHHFTTDKEDKIVKRMQKMFKKKEPLDAKNEVYVTGYVFLTQQQEWSFTLQKKGSNSSYVVIVGSDARGKGSVFKLLGINRKHAHAAYKRSWFGYSPVGQDAYSLKIVGAY